MSRRRLNPDPVILSVRIDRKLLARLDSFRSRTGRSRAELTSEALDRHLPAKDSLPSPEPGEVRLVGWPMIDDAGNVVEVPGELVAEVVFDEMVNAPMLMPDGRCAMCGTTHDGDCPPIEPRAVGLIAQGIEAWPASPEEENGPLNLAVNDVKYGPQTPRTVATTDLPTAIEPDVRAVLDHELSRAFERAVLGEPAQPTIVEGVGSIAEPLDFDETIAELRERMTDEEPNGTRVPEIVEGTLHNTICAHPKEHLKHLSYGTFCDLCHRKVR